MAFRARYTKYVPDFVRYYLRWAWTAIKFHRSFAAADGLAGAITIFSPPIIPWLVPEPSSSEAKRIMDDLAWQIPVATMGLLTAVRFIMAPYWISVEDRRVARAKEEALQKGNEALLRQTLSAAAKNTIALELAKRYQTATRLMTETISSDQQLEEWEQRVSEWAKESIVYIRTNISPSEAVLFNRTTTSPMLNFETRKYNEEHNGRLNDIHYHSIRLEELMRQFDSNMVSKLTLANLPPNPDTEDDPIITNT